MGNNASRLQPPRDIVQHVVLCSPWTDCAAIFRTNRAAASLLQDDSFWGLLCRRLASAHGLYVSPSPSSGSWQDYFNDLWPHRNCWAPLSPPTAEGGGAPGLRFSIGVSVRLRDGALDSAAATASPVVLPLHQRLQTIRALHKCTGREAQKHLWGAGAAAPFDPFQTAAVTGSRSRSGSTNADAPPPQAAVAGTRLGFVSVAPKDILFCAPGCGLRQFNFDCVMDERTQQEEVYDAVARGVVTDFMNGINGCIFCYGQTGSGKTFTMFGSDEVSSTAVEAPQGGAGIVPRACAEVIRAVQTREASGIAAQLSVSCVEVFGDEVTDLLHEGAAIGHWAGVAARAVLQGSAKEAISTEAELQQLLLRAEGAKRRAATAMNERSSRAHTLLFLFLQQNRGPAALVSQLCLADLGGSEQLKKSQATGERVQEAVNINLGLLALNKCITALNEGHPHVPYQDSRLTTLLAGSLGGAARTVVVVTATTAQEHATETLQSLRFGERCSQVEEKEGKRGFVIREALEALDAEIAECEQLIKRDERWESRQVVREDVEGREVQLTTVPVGAEEHRARLEQLLEKRSAIMGG